MSASFRSLLFAVGLFRLNNLDRQPPDRVVDYLDNLKTRLFDGLPDVDRAAIHIAWYLAMRPLIEFDHQTLFPLPGHRDYAEPPTHFQRSATLSQNDGDFRSVEKLEREAHKNRVKELRRKRERRCVAALQFHSFSQPGAQYSFACDFEHPFRNINAIDFACIADRVR